MSENNKELKIPVKILLTPRIYKKATEHIVRHETKFSLLVEDALYFYIKAIESTREEGC